MATTQNTLPYGTYANPTTPLWATANAGQQFTSPSEVVNQLIPPTAELSTIVNNDGTARFELNTIPNGTPLNEIRFEGVNNGIVLFTNGEPTLVSTSSTTGVIGDFFVTSQQTGGTWGFNNNELAYNGVKQVTGDQTFTQLGENTYTDTYGLSVWGLGGSSKTSTISDREIYFTTSTGGSNTNQTYSFVSPLVPFTTTGDPNRITPNPRTPLYPNDASFFPNTAGSTLTVTGGSGTPYSVQVTNTSGGATSGIGVSIARSNGDNLYSTNFPFWVEIEIFDPLTSQYLFYDGASLVELLKEIKKVGGVITGIPANSLSPVTFVVGDKVRAVYEWADKVNKIPRIVITKNNVTLSTLNLPVVPFVAQYEPTFFNTTSIANGFSYTLPFNYGNTSDIIASFNDWEWTAGLGGLYGYDNLNYKPAPSGSSPNSTTFYSIVYLKENCRFTSPPIIINNNVVVTISAYSGSRFGTGTINVYVNNALIYTSVASPSWIQGSLGTYTSTGSDTIVFEFVGSPNDTLSLQRINLNYNNAVDVLDGGMGMNGTDLHIGAGNYYSFPTIAMTTSNINITKPINMNTFAISNGSFSGNINTNSIAPISPATSTQVGNLNLSNSIISNVGILSTNSLTAQGVGTLSIGSPISMSAGQNISNVGTLSSVNISNSGYILTPVLNSTTATLDIGTLVATTNIYNTNSITGRSAGFPLYINLCSTLNRVPAIPTGIIYIQTNFGGFRRLAIPLIPTQELTDTTMYSLAGDNYTGTEGYTIAGHSTLSVWGPPYTAPAEEFFNSGEAPRFYAGSQMVLNSATAKYIYKVYLPSL